MFKKYFKITFNICSLYHLSISLEQHFHNAMMHLHSIFTLLENKNPTQNYLLKFILETSRLFYAKYVIICICSMYVLICNTKKLGALFFVMIKVVSLILGCSWCVLYAFKNEEISLSQRVLDTCFKNY